MGEKKIRISCATNEGAGLQAPILFRSDICANMRAAARLGFDAVEIHAREQMPENVHEILQLKQALGLEVSALVTGRLYTQGGKCLTSTDPENQAAAVRGMESYIRQAAVYGTDLIIGWIRGSCRADEPMEAYEQRLAAVLAPLERQAADAGVRLLIEGINRYEVNTFNTAFQIQAFTEKYGLHNTYVHLDSFHMNIEEENPAEAIRSCGSRLGYFHVADNTRRWPGSGTIDFSAQIHALHSIGYQGYISVECLPIPSGEVAAEESLRYMRAVLEKAEREDKV